MRWLDWDWTYDGSSADPWFERAFGGMIRGLRRLRGDRYPETAVAPGFVLRLRVRRDGSQQSFAILRDRRIAPPGLRGEYLMTHMFSRPFRAWSELMAVVSAPDRPLPKHWRLDVEAGLVIVDTEGGCMTLPIPVVAAIDRLLGRCIATPSLRVDEEAGL